MPLDAGIDEAGRGPLAGPVYAAVVILPEKVPKPLKGLDDSKKLSPPQREAFSILIRKHALAFSVASAGVAEIEKINILGATFLAMRRALEGLPIKPERLLVDGNRDPRLGLETLTIVRGDAKVPCISAASILAKVERDRHMEELHKMHPQYGFDEHKGYGTGRHRAAILEHGPCPAHRLSFLAGLNQLELGLG